MKTGSDRNTSGNYKVNPIKKPFNCLLLYNQKQKQIYAIICFPPIKKIGAKGFI